GPHVPTLPVSPEGNSLALETSAGGDQGAELVQRPGVEDVGGGQPAAPGAGDAELHEAQLGGAVSVAADREVGAEPEGAASPGAVQVQPVRSGVELERTSNCRGALDHGLHVDGVALASTDLASVGVVERVDEQIRNRSQDALRHHLAGLAK